MDFDLTDEDTRYARELREYLDAIPEGELSAARSFDIIDMSNAAYAFRRRLGRDGWLALPWPVEYGGRGASAVQAWLASEELAVRRLPLPGLSVTSLGPTLIRRGSQEQKEEFLPGVRDASKLIALGYTEPDAGTDLASLQCRAVRDGHGYRVDGQKIFTSGAHHATHIWTAVRTDPDAPKRDGISILIIPTDADGMTITPLTTQAGERTNQVFFDNVFVDARYRVGAENDGWAIVRTALDFERMSLIPASAIRRDWQDLAGLMQDRYGHEWSHDGNEPRGNVDAASSLFALAELRVDAEIARLLFVRTALLADEGVVPHAEASFAKVWSSETRMRMSSAALDLMGPDGQYPRGAAGAPLDGDFAWLYLFSPVKRFGGGTNEVQRQLAARARLKELGHQ